MFSDLNQLNDISLDYSYATVCGITRTELVETFTPEIEEFGRINKLSAEETVNKMARQTMAITFIRKETEFLILSVC